MVTTSDEPLLGAKDFTAAIYDATAPPAFPEICAWGIPIHTWSLTSSSAQKVDCLTFARNVVMTAFSVNHSSVERVSKYIGGQREHHRKVTFEEELILFLERSRIDYDPRYLWQ